MSYLQRLVKRWMYPFQIRADLGREAYERILADPRHADARCLVRYGAKTFSQNDEDGVIAEILHRIGVTNKKFVEFGVGDGLENNTAALLCEDWRGLWIDGSKQQVEAIRQGLPRTIASGQLVVEQSFITRENINDLIGKHFRGEIDLLVVDLDGNDAHIAGAIDCVSPRVLVVEYNAKFLPHVDYCLAYNPTHVWRGDDCFGASLKHWERRLGKKGYSLVGCTPAGVNAYFVRNDLLGDKFLPPFTAEQHYQPPRYYLAGLVSGHRPAYATIDGRERGSA